MSARAADRQSPAGRRPPGFFGTLWRLLLVGGLLFLGAGAAGYGVVWRLVKTSEIQAPDLLTLDLRDALLSASEEGFPVRVGGREPSTVLGRGKVVAQRPLPGEWVKEGATIQLTVAE